MKREYSKGEEIMAEADGLVLGPDDVFPKLHKLALGWTQVKEQ